jgi:hypothetical protein
MYYHRNIRDYSDNLHEYNQNMMNYLSIISHQARYLAVPNPPRRSIRQSSRNTLNSLLNNYVIRNNRNYQRDLVENLDFSLYDQVIIRPNNEQIDNATEHIQYTNELSQNTCPITLDAFQEGEQLSRIIHCGHIFKEIALNQWFQRNVRCPVCRYDIRDYVRPQESDENINEESEFDDVIRELNQELNQELNNSRGGLSQSSRPNPDTPPSNNLMNIIRRFINNELQHFPTNTPFNEIIYTFDIPIDISGNRYRV